MCKFFNSYEESLHLGKCKLAKYVRNCVVFRENLHSWQKFYTTAGRDGRDKFQVWKYPFRILTVLKTLKTHARTWFLSLLNLHFVKQGKNHVRACVFRTAKILYLDPVFIMPYKVCGFIYMSADTSNLWVGAYKLRYNLQLVRVPMWRHVTSILGRNQNDMSHGLLSLWAAIWGHCWHSNSCNTL